MKNTEIEIKKRRKILASLLLENKHFSDNELIQKLAEYDIKVTRQTIHVDKQYLKDVNLKKYIRTDTGLWLEIRHKKLEDKIEKLESMQEEKYSETRKRTILGYNKQVTDIEFKLDGIAATIVKANKPVYNVIIGTQKVVNVAKYKSKK